MDERRFVENEIERYTIPPARLGALARAAPPSWILACPAPCGRERGHDCLGRRRCGQRGRGLASGTSLRHAASCTPAEPDPTMSPCEEIREV